MALLNRAPVLPTRGRVSIKTSAVARPQKVAKKAVPAGVKLENALLLASTAFISAGPAFAEEADDVDSAVDAVIDAVKSTAGFVKSGITTVQSGLKVVKEGYDVAAPVIKQGVEAVTPVVSATVKAVTDVASPAIKAAAPVVTDTLSSALESTGLDLKTVGTTTTTVTKTAATAAAATTPYLTQVYNFLTTTEPVLLAEYALGALALVYLAPALLGSVFRPTLTITAGLALDAVVNESNIALIDIRTPKDKETSGLPDVPSAAASKVIEVEYAALEDKKLRGQLRDPGFIEAQTTALQIASLKRIGKGSKVLLLDRYGSGAVAVARELQNKGFSKVYIIEGGFDGRGGWVQSKLQIKPYFSAFAAPAKIGTRGTKALPAPRSA